MSHHSHTEEAKPSTKPPCSCGCRAPAPPDPCCELICFERPNYFCGHLLTDADLKLEQKYVREKLKLYHRTLHGHGVVCGLRLTCDHECPGRIIIGEGYAIDDCGNDLIVCEAMPFDVLGELHVEPVKPDPCAPKKEEPRCKIHECYQVMICYAEEPTQFTTPFVAGCRPMLSECEPTRIRETVRFKLADTLPKKLGFFEQYKELRCCLELFTKGKFYETLQSPIMAAALGGPQGNYTAKEFSDLFCQLKYWLVAYLSKHPDRYNCAILQEIEGVPYDETNRQEAFCELLQIAWRHVVGCVLGALLPTCPEPCSPGCVVLGTVEIEDGKLVRVCNCPREYVWSFANLFPVLIATIAGWLACTRKEEGDLCCSDFRVACEGLAHLLGIQLDAEEGKTFPEAASTTTKAFAASQAHMKLRQALGRISPAAIQSRLAGFVELDEGTIKGFKKVLQTFGLAEIGEPVAAPTGPAATWMEDIQNVIAERDKRTDEIEKKLNAQLADVQKKLNELRGGGKSGQKRGK